MFLLEEERYLDPDQPQAQPQAQPQDQPQDQPQARSSLKRKHECVSCGECSIPNPKERSKFIEDCLDLGQYFTLNFSRHPNLAF